MIPISEEFTEKWEAYRRLAGPWEWLTALCHLPFRGTDQAEPAWTLLLPHLDREGPFPIASALDLERAWTRVYGHASLERGLELLTQRFDIDTWFRKTPQRFLKTAKMLGSLSEQRQEMALERASAHPFLRPNLEIPAEDLGRFCLETWSPLPPPSRIAEAYGRKLSPQEDRELRLSIDNWIPLVQLEILRYYCGVKIARARLVS